MLCVLFFCVFLWEKEQLRDSLGRFFSHRTHRFNRPFLRTVSISQNASGIQISQNLSTHVSNNVLWYLSSACRRLWVPPVRRKASVHLWKSVRDRIHHEPRRSLKGFCSSVKLCERWNIQRALFKTKFSVETNPTTTKESKHLQTRNKKGLVMGQEGRLQHTRRACSGMMKGLFSKCIERILGLRRVKIVYMSYDSV